MAKIGTGHAEAMLRQGLKELRAAVYPGSNVAQPQEYGLYGTATPGEVAQARNEQPLALEDESPRSGSVLEQHIASATAHREPPAPERSLDRG